MPLAHEDYTHEPPNALIPQCAGSLPPAVASNWKFNLGPRLGPVVCSRSMNIPITPALQADENFAFHGTNEQPAHPIYNGCLAPDLGPENTSFESAIVPPESQGPQCYTVQEYPPTSAFDFDDATIVGYGFDRSNMNEKPHDEGKE